MHELPMYQQCPRMDLGATDDLARRLVNVPRWAGLTKGGGAPPPRRRGER